MRCFGSAFFLPFSAPRRDSAKRGRSTLPLPAERLTRRRRSLQMTHLREHATGQFLGLVT